MKEAVSEYAPVRRRGRKRAALACQQCHQRKVRCNVTHTGPPCVNCVQDDIRCEIVARGRGQGQHRLAKILAQGRVETGCQAASVSNGSAVQRQTPSPRTNIPLSPQTDSDATDAANIPDSAAPSQLWLTATPDSAAVSQEVIQGATPPELSRVGVREGISPRRQPQESEQPSSDTGYCAMLDDDREDDEEEEEPAVIYAGDQQGLKIVVDICKPDRKSSANHFIVPRAAATSSLSPEDLSALQARGCFSLPSEAVREGLLRSYFHHVHPMLPIIDAGKFVNEYETGGAMKINLLLLWSMFFAATNFLDDATIKEAGYTSRKLMKQALYRRAKALYDADYEKDKIPLIQAVILLAFWYVDAEDRNGSWHWIGIAISLGQTIGLHRSLSLESSRLLNRSKQRASSISGNHGRLWRLIWWTCYFRDTWLSFGVGRPTRINLSDCDTPIPTTSDVEALWADASPAAASKYFPPDTKTTLAQTWTCLMEATFALWRILKAHYKAKQQLRPPPIEAIDRDMKDLIRCRSAFPSEDSCDEGSVALVHLYHLHVYYEACVIALHRPYLVALPDDQDDTTSESVQVRLLRRANSAASNINGVLNKIIASRMINICQPMMVTAIIPALQIHLFQSVSSESLTKILARHQLDMCLAVLEELRPTFWAADMIHSLFSKARGQLLKSGAWNSHPGTSTASGQAKSSEVGYAAGHQDWCHAAGRAASGHAQKISTSTDTDVSMAHAVWDRSSSANSRPDVATAAANTCPENLVSWSHQGPEEGERGSNSYSTSVQRTSSEIQSAFDAELSLANELFPFQLDLPLELDDPGIWSPQTSLNVILNGEELSNFLY